MILILIFFLIASPSRAAQTAPIIISAPSLTPSFASLWGEASPSESINLLSSSHLNGGAKSLMLDGAPSHATQIVLDGLPLEDATTPDGNVDLEAILPGIYDEILLDSADHTFSPGGIIELANHPSQTQEIKGHTKMSPQGASQTFDLQHFKGQDHFRFILHSGYENRANPVPAYLREGKETRSHTPSRDNHLYFNFKKTGLKGTTLFTTHRWGNHQSHYTNIYGTNPNFKSTHILQRHTLGLIHEGKTGDLEFSPFMTWGYTKQSRYHQNETPPTLSKNSFVGDSFALKTGISFVKKKDWGAKFHTLQTLEYSTLNSQAPAQTPEKRNRHKQEYWIKTHKWITSSLRLDGEGGTKVAPRSKANPDYRVGLTQDLGPSLKVGQVFVAYSHSSLLPTLFQQYSKEYGNSALIPEKAQKVTWGGKLFLPHKIQLQLTFFKTHFSNLINYNLATRKYENLHKASAQGIKSKIIKHFDEGEWFLCHGYTNAKDNLRRQRLAVPLHKISGGIRLSITDDVSATISGHILGKTADFDPFTNLRIYRGSVNTFNGSISRQINAHTKIYLRIENILNRRYEMPRGFLQKGLSLYAGLKYLTLKL